MTASSRRGEFATRFLLGLVLVGGVAIGLGSRSPDRGTTTLLVVRHADRLGKEDALSADGLVRAQDLARVAEKSGVAAIYQSDTHRARLTAAPAAAALGLTPVELPAADVDGLVKHIFAHERGKTVLVVGHSNTVPKIIAAAGGPTLADIPEDEFDNLFVLTVDGRGSSRLVNLQYGADSPPAPARAQPPDTTEEKAVTMMHATGAFDVKLAAQPADGHADGAILGRMTIDKQFHGDLEATSRGQMLTGMSSVKGSAGYVAVEQVDGVLKGRKGTFILQHSGTMNRGAPSLTITVVPDSGTGELVGLAGTMTIIIADGRHSYDFEYTIAKAP